MASTFRSNRGIFCAFFFIAFAATDAQAQCNTDLYNNLALKKLAPGYTFVKSYRIDGKKGSRKKIEYTCVFSKGTDYMIRMAGKDGGPNGLIATLYDSRRSQLATSYLNNKYYDNFFNPERQIQLYRYLYTSKT